MRFEFDFTEEQLGQIIQGNRFVKEWFEALSNSLPEYEITSIPRVAAFLAQTAHESANYRTLKENLNYRAESLMRVWPSRFPTMEIAEQYAMQPEKIANRAYADRMGNGPESSGDGWRYAGKGLIQLTGKENYTRFANSIGMTPEEVSEYLQTFDGAVKSACWFWADKNLNPLADAGDMLTLTRRINGGTNGLEDRVKHYNHALRVFGNGTTSNENHNAPNTNVVLRKGSSGGDVAMLQTRLGIQVDGNFGPGTERALMEWQRNNGLVADGIAGPATMAKLLG